MPPPQFSLDHQRPPLRGTWPLPPLPPSPSPSQPSTWDRSSCKSPASLGHRASVPADPSRELPFIKWLLNVEQLALWAGKGGLDSCMCQFSRCKSSHRGRPPAARVS